MLVFYCDHCGRKLGAKDSALGRTFCCLNCGQPVVARNDPVPVEPTEPEPAQSLAPATATAPEYASADDSWQQDSYAASEPENEAGPENYVPAGYVSMQGYAPAVSYPQPDQSPSPAAAAVPEFVPGETAPAPRPAGQGIKWFSPKWLTIQIGGSAAVLTIAIVLILHNRSSPDSASVGDAPTPATPSAFSATTQPDDDSSKSSRPALSASPSADASHPPPSDVHLSPQVLFAQASPSVGRMDHLDSRGRPVAFGTGFFVSADGLVVTNYHVLEGASGARFVLDESREFPVEGFVAADHGHDLMLVKVKAAGVPYLRVWAGDPPPVGAQIYAIGNPEGLSNTLSNGLVSGIRKDGSEVAQIQINAAITHGSSGGPLLTESGLVVGVTSSGMGEANLNFAIPSRQVDRLIHSAGAVHSIADLGKMQTDAEAARIVLIAMQLTSGGHPAEALAVLDNVITDKRENWRYWFAKGLAHEAQGMSVLGEFDFKNAQRLGPDIASAWETIGAAYMNKDKPDSAAECFTKALDRDPFSIPAYAGLAQADIKAGKASDAVAVCTRGLAKTGDNAELLDILGQCYIATKDPESATKTFEQAVKIDSRNSRALIDLGLAYKSAGRAKEARETLNKVFSSDTDARVLEKQAARKALNSLEEGPQ